MPPESAFPGYGRITVKNTRDTAESNKSTRVLTVALSVQAKEFPQRFQWARDNAFALEYTPEPLSPELVFPQVKPYLSDGIPVRFHCRFFEHELGNADPAKAAKALRVHMSIIDAIENLGEPVITVHLNLRPAIPFDAPTGVANLTRLAEYGRKKGITVCVENLRRGPSSDPRNIAAWAEKSGAGITLDIGHAVCSEVVKNGEMTVTGIIDLFSSRLHEVHMYGKEEDRHYPIEDITPLKPAIDRLLTTGCDWWTIELDDYAEALATRKIITDYLC